MTQTPFEQAKALFLDGLACYEAGRYGEAEQRFVASQALLPQRVSTLVNLAATRLKLSRLPEALEAADQVLAIEPLNRDAWLHRANALHLLHHDEQALAAFDQLLAIDPTLALAWGTRGDILRELGRLGEAEQSYRQALAHGGDAELTGYCLAALNGHKLPAAAPRGYVQALFDGYAGEFDQHLVQVLRYRAHEVLTRSVQALHAARFSSALDLGCGTGLCGPGMKAMADRLVGVDLSSQMLDKARALGVYDHLAHADIVEHLQSTPEHHDLVVAADVFIYIGDLAPIFAAVSRLMPPGGVFSFSAEVASRDHGFELLPSLRYAHSERYLRELAVQHGFQVKSLALEAIREDQRQAIDGVFVHLMRT